MSCVFPSSTPSAEAWIESLNLHQYAPLFAHLTVEELYHLTDLQLKAMGVSVAGHRKRLLIGAAKLQSANSPTATHADLSKVSVQKVQLDDDLSYWGKFTRTSITWVPAVPVTAVSKASSSGSGSTLWPKSSKNSGSSSGSSRSWSQLENIHEVDGSSLSSPECVRVSMETAIIRRLRLRVASLLCATLAGSLFTPQLLAAPLGMGCLFLCLPLAMASFWPSDDALQVGLGWRVMTMCDVSAVVRIVVTIRDDWYDAALYPLHSQAVLHQVLLTVWLVSSVHHCVNLFVGRGTWRSFRAQLVLNSWLPFFGLVGLHILDGHRSLNDSHVRPRPWRFFSGAVPHAEAADMLRWPTHACHLPICQENDTLIGAWAAATILILAGGIAAACLTSPTNRDRVSRFTGLTHVRLRLGELQELPPEDISSQEPKSSRNSDSSSCDIRRQTARTRARMRQTWRDMMAEA